MRMVNVFPSGDPTGLKEARSLYQDAMAELERGHHAEAERLLLQLLSELSAGSDDQGLLSLKADALNTLGAIMGVTGRSEEAAEYFRAASDILHQLLESSDSDDVLDTLIHVLGNLATADIDTGDFDEALVALTEAADLLEPTIEEGSGESASIGAHAMMAGLMTDLAYVKSKLEKVHDALCDYDVALNTCTVLMDHDPEAYGPLMGNLLGRMGKSMSELGLTSIAELLYFSAYSTWRELDAKYGIGRKESIDVLRTLERLYEEMGRSKALAEVQEEISKISDTNYKQQVAGINRFGSR